MADDLLSADVLIVGGGLVGMTLGCALAGAGVTCVVVERDDPARWADAAFDGRTIAVAQGSKRVLATLGVWLRLAQDACPITDIRVRDRDGPQFLHFDSTELDEGPLGYIVENRVMRLALLAQARSLPALTLLAPARLRSLERDGGQVHGRILADGARPRQVRAAIVLACDGRQSALREDAGIESWRWRYDQQAIVCTIAHQRSHRNVAHELFFNDGPLAMLPMTDGPADAAAWRHRSSIVWSAKADLVPPLMATDPAQFCAELAVRIGGVLGDIALVGERFCHPLSLSHARRYTARRLALVGDAAHVTHPIAGQGWNMGLRDAAALAQILVDARRLGLDLGSDRVLGDYEVRRRFDNSTLASMTDGLTRLFGVGHGAVTAVRQAGLATVNQTGPARRALMRHAMGLPALGLTASGLGTKSTGEGGSRLARGQPL